MKVDNDVINILADSTIEDNKLFLPNVQLDRKMYLAVNKVLEALGGRWDRYEKAHIFDKPIGNAIEQVIQEGEYTDKKKEYQFFETPPAIAKQVVELASISESDKVLEPSAGKGRIAKKTPFGCECVEILPENRKHLQEEGYQIAGEDFLEVDKSYDVIVANPPFSKQQDIDHVLHMISLAKKRVVSVMSASVLFRENKKTVKFREKVKRLGGEFIELPDGAFKSSGTGVRTCIVKIDLEAA